MKRLKISVVLLFVFSTLCSSLSFADTQFRIIVDASGSMVTSDPDRITSEAIELLSDLSPENKASIGVWLFGEQPRVLFPESLVTPDSQRKLSTYVNNYVTQDLKTDLESILNLLLKTPDIDGLSGNYSRHWILVTDGMVDISLDPKVNEASRQRIWGSITQTLEDKGIHLHSISLTGYTDKPLLDHLSFRTNATHTEAAVPEDVLDTFERIFSQAYPSEELPLNEDHFKVDNTIEEMTVEMLHDAGAAPKLIQPDGQEFVLSNRPGVRISEAPHFTLVTITKPQEGQWTLKNADLERTHIRVLSHLIATTTNIAPLVFTKESIHSKIAFFKSGTPLTDTRLLEGVTVKQRLYRIAGGNREFVETYYPKEQAKGFDNRISHIAMPGQYELTTRVESPSFDRLVRQYFTVEPAVSFSAQNSGTDFVTFSASPTNSKLDTSLSDMKLLLTYPDGSQKTEEMPFLSQGYWEKVIPVPSDGLIKARGILEGISEVGTKINDKTPIWTINRETDGSITIKRGNLTEAQDQADPQDATITSQEVAPLSVSPNVDVVNNSATPAPAANAPESTVIKANNVMTKVVQDAKDATQNGNWVYIIIGVIALLLIVLVFFISRRAKGRDRYQGDDSNDV